MFKKKKRMKAAPKPKGGRKLAQKAKVTAGRTAKAKANPKAKATVKAPRNRGLSFGFLIFVFLFLAATGVFMLVQHQYAVRNDLKETSLSTKIANEKSRQETLRLSLARLKSPGRVARIAGDELGLGEPSGVIYLKYARDASGNIVCQSTFEKRVVPEPAPKPEEKPAGDTQASVVEGPGGALTRR
jgi:cell division protein FtsL